MERDCGVRSLESDQNHAGPTDFDKGFCIYPKNSGTPLKGGSIIRSSFREDCSLSMEASGEYGQSSQGAINSGLLGENTGSLG